MYVFDVNTTFNIRCLKSKTNTVPVYAMIMHFFLNSANMKTVRLREIGFHSFTLLKDTGNKFATFCGRCWTEQPRDGAGAGEDVLPRENPSHRQVQCTSSATRLMAVSMINFLQYFVPYENQGCGSALIKCGSGSSIFPNCGSGSSSESRVLMTQKNYSWKKIGYFVDKKFQFCYP